MEWVLPKIRNAIATCWRRRLPHTASVPCTQSTVHQNSSGSGTDSKIGGPIGCPTRCCESTPTPSRPWSPPRHHPVTSSSIFHITPFSPLHHLHLHLHLHPIRPSTTAPTEHTNRCKAASHMHAMDMLGVIEVSHELRLKQRARHRNTEPLATHRNKDATKTRPRRSPCRCATSQPRR